MEDSHEDIDKIQGGFYGDGDMEITKFMKEFKPRDSNPLFVGFI
jgi:hypothetical protein